MREGGDDGGATDDNNNKMGPPFGPFRLPSFLPLSTFFGGCREGGGESGADAVDATMPSSCLLPSSLLPPLMQETLSFTFALSLSLSLSFGACVQRRKEEGNPFCSN